MKFKLNYRELGILVPILAICILLFLLTADFPVESRRYPQMILIGIGLLTLIEIVSQNLKKKSTGDEQDIEKKNSPEVSRRILIVAAMCLCYVLLVDFLGFFSSTAIFSIALLYYLGIRKITTLLSVAMGLNLGVYLLFVAFLRIGMPRGFLF